MVEMTDAKVKARPERRTTAKSSFLKSLFGTRNFVVG
jgi:hypothetical protein